MLSVQAANNQAVTPAQAGVHSDFSPRINGKMDSSIRWNDAVRRMATKDALNKLSLRGAERRGIRFRMAFRP